MHLFLRDDELKLALIQEKKSLFSAALKLRHKCQPE